MGGGKKLCLGGTLSPFGSRLRTTRRYSWSFPFPRLRMPDDRPALQATGLKLITGSSHRNNTTRHKSNAYSDDSQLSLQLCVWCVSTDASGAKVQSLSAHSRVYEFWF